MAARAQTDDPEQSASDRSRENSCCERYCFIQVTCNMNAKSQAWNEKIWTVTRPKEKHPS